MYIFTAEHDVKAILQSGESYKKEYKFIPASYLVDKIFMHQVVPRKLPNPTHITAQAKVKYERIYTENIRPPTGC